MSLTASIRSHLVLAERFILKNLGFAVYSYADYPHKYTPALVKSCSIPPEVMQNTWNACNDAMLLDLVLDFSGLEIAVACIAVGLQKCNVSRAVWNRYLEEVQRMQIDYPGTIRWIVQKIEELYSGAS